jgi:hypothetical protein
MVGSDIGAMLRTSASARWVVTLSDGVTVHNAFPDRAFEEESR